MDAQSGKSPSQGKTPKKAQEREGAEGEASLPLPNLSRLGGP